MFGSTALGRFQSLAYLGTTWSGTVSQLKSERLQITFRSYLRLARQRLLNKHWNFPNVLTR